VAHRHQPNRKRPTFGQLDRRGECGLCVCKPLNFGLARDPGTIATFRLCLAALPEISLYSVGMPLSPGDRIGCYEIIALLGAGGMAKSIARAI